MLQDKKKRRRYKHWNVYKSLKLYIEMVTSKCTCKECLLRISSGQHHRLKASCIHHHSQASARAWLRTETLESCPCCWTLGIQLIWRRICSPRSSGYLKTEWYNMRIWKKKKKTQRFKGSSSLPLKYSYTFVVSVTGPISRCVAPFPSCVLIFLPVRFHPSVLPSI